MNKKRLEYLINSYIRDNLNLGILDNIFEICKIYEKNNEDSYENMEDNIKVMIEKLPNYFYNIKNVVSKELEKRENFISDIKKDIKEIEKLSLPIIAILRFSEFLESMLDNYHKILLVKKQEISEFDKQEFLDLTYNFLYSKDDLKEIGAFFISLVNYNMLRDDYKDYINKSLNILFKDTSKEFVEAKINELKITFAPFEYLDEDEDTKILLNILDKKYSSMEKDELVELIETINDIYQKYDDKMANIEIIYDCYIEMLAIYNFTVDKDYIFDDLTIKEIYYQFCELIQNNDFLLYKNIKNTIDKKYNKLCTNLINNKRIINKQISKQNASQYSDIIKNYITINDYFDTFLEKNVMFQSECNDKTIVSQDFIDNKINDFIEFIGNLDVNNLILKKLKQSFFWDIPYPLDLNYLMSYIERAIDGLEIEQKIIISSRILPLVPEYFEDTEENWEFYEE